jgi:uncharacterized protein (DUF1697 family)
MNIGGRRITNADLCACFEALGAVSVSAFLASGNVVFEAKGAAKVVARRVCSGLNEQLGYEVPTFLRTAAEIRAVADQDPFADRAGAVDRGKLQVAFLMAAPSAAAVASALEHESDDDWLCVIGRELFWLPVGRLSDSALNFKAIDKVLGHMTVRTKNTVDRFVTKYFN